MALNFQFVKIRITATQPPARHKQTSCRQGFVLPLTMMVISLTTVVMVGVARQSLQVAEHAIQAEQDLQKRWGTISCRRSLLERADLLLDEATWQSSQSPARQVTDPLRDAGHLRAVIQLGSLKFDVLIADEDAKFNLNTAMSLQNLSTVTQHLQSLTSHETLPIRLTPERLQSTASPGEQFLFSSWGQVFRHDQIKEAADIPRQVASASTRLTCWGDGKLNIRRADEPSIRAVCALVGAERAVPKLLAASNQATDLDVIQLIDASDLRGEEITKLTSLITGQSACFSMWVKVSHHGKSTYELHVIQEEKKKDRPDDLILTPKWNTIARFAW